VLFSVPSFLPSHGGFLFLVSARRKYHIAVAGRGMQMVEFSLPEDGVDGERA
jgi:hypothetical protein